MMRIWGHNQKKFYITGFIACVVLFLASFGFVTAQSDQSSTIVDLSVLTDSNPPTDPSGLSTTPVSSSQINLTWVASIDDNVLLGYKIFRNNVFIATTSLSTFYSAVGLAADTSYDFTVSAFDSVFNESGKSATSTATTQVASGGGGGGSVPPTPPIISNMVTDTGYYTATTTWSTDKDTLSTYSYGTSTDYSLGTINEVGFHFDHIVELENLESSEIYYYRITFEDQIGISGTPYTGSFTTDTTPDTAPPANVDFFTATTTLVGAINLSWVNPIDSDFELVRVTRSEIFYPADPLEGIVVYEGTLEEILDTGVATSTQYYYTAFAKDTNDNYASGAIADAIIYPPDVDLTPPAEVSSLTSSFTLPDSVSLSWVNPVDTDFDRVRIVRSMLSYPNNHLSEVLVYEGVLETFIDSGLVVNTDYYYTVFAGDVNDNFSLGNSVLGYIVFEEPEPDPDPDLDPDPVDPDPVDPDPIDPDPVDPGPGGSNPDPDPIDPDPIDPELDPNPDPIDTSDPLDNLPSSPDAWKRMIQLTIFDFDVYQNGKRIKFEGSGIAEVDISKPVNLVLDYKKVPEVLKTITVTLTDPEDSNKKFSFLMRINNDKDAYEATFGSLERIGVYPLDIRILDHMNRKLKTVDGRFETYEVTVPEKTIIEEVFDIFDPIIPLIIDPPPVVTEVIAPVVGVAGVTVGLSQTVLLLGNVSSLNNIWLLVLRLLSTIAAIFTKKKNKPWGVVYDAETKRPLDPAYVVLNDMEGNTVATAVTDLDGRYGFLVKPGEYKVIANKTNYAFPSKTLDGHAKDELYDNLYFGGHVTLGDENVVRFNIPLDPVGFDWNEYEKQRLGLFEVHSKKQKYITLISNVVFFFGFVFSLYTAWIVPKVLNLAIVGVYTIILTFRILWKGTHRITRIVDDETGAPLSFAVVSILMPGNNILIKKVVADEVGQFYLLVAPGTYYLKVEQPLGGGQYETVYTSEPIEFEKGFMTADVKIPHENIKKISHKAHIKPKPKASKGPSLAEMAVQMAEEEKQNIATPIKSDITLVKKIEKPTSTSGSMADISRNGNKKFKSETSKGSSLIETDVQKAEVEKQNIPTTLKPDIIPVKTTEKPAPTSGSMADISRKGNKRPQPPVPPKA